VGAWSTVFTAWKRVYVERAKMFRRGGVLARSYGPREPGCGGPDEPECPFCGHDDYPPCCGTDGQLPCDQIEVYDWDNVSGGVVVCVFDEINTYPDNAEYRILTGIQPSSGFDGEILTLDEPLHQDYRAATTHATEDQPIFRNLHSAGIGVVTGCELASDQINGLYSCFYEVDMQGIERPFNDAFVEVMALRDGMSTVPYLPPDFFNTGWLSEHHGPLDSFSRTWFAHWSVDPGDEFSCAPNNYFHLLGGTKASDRLGLTHAGSNTSFVLTQGIGLVSPVTGGPFEHAVQTVTNHEIGHQFNVNPCVCNMHDLRDAWCAATDSCGDPGLSHTVRCIMNLDIDTDANREDGVEHFCTQDLLHGGPGCSDLQCSEHDIRTYPAGSGAIRTALEPE